MSYQKGVQILEATVGVEANRRALFPRFPLKIEVPSLLTDFRDMVEIPFGRELDGCLVLENTPSNRTEYSCSGRKAVFRGPLLKLEKNASDIRYSLWGNQGFLYRFILYLLEWRHAIFSFHAAGLYDKRNHVLFVVAGGAGSGKTVYLLSGIAKGLKLFSTETVHFRFEQNGLTWFKGSLVDNIRLGTLIHDFPQFCSPQIVAMSGGEVWQKKISLDLAFHQSEEDRIIQPRLILVFPRIEEGRAEFAAQSIKDKRKAAKAVFDNLSQKIAESVVLYDHLPLPGLDNAALAEARLKASFRLIEHGSIGLVASVLSNPARCWGDLLEGR
jgi:hypothetical protein